MDEKITFTINNSITPIKYLENLLFCAEYYRSEYRLSIEQNIITQFLNPNFIPIIRKTTNPLYNNYVTAKREINIYHNDNINISTNETKKLPLDYIKNIKDSKKLAEVILINAGTKINKLDSYFTLLEIKLLASILWYLKSNNPQYFSIEEAFKIIDETPIQNPYSLLKMLSTNSKSKEIITSLLENNSLIEPTLYSLKIRSLAFFETKIK